MEDVHKILQINLHHAKGATDAFSRRFISVRGAIQPERTGTPFRFKDFLENGVPVHFGKIQTELTIL
jgi:hypothetical protein